MVRAVWNGAVLAESADAYYPEPKEAASRIAGRVAFWHGVLVVEE